MSCGEDHPAEILLDIENGDRGNYAKVEWHPGISAVGRLENPDVGRGQHSVPGWIVAIDQQSQHWNVG